MVEYAFFSLAREPSAAEEGTLDDDERARAARFVHARDRRRFVVAHAALRSFLAERLEIEPTAVRFSRDSSGKPRLASGLPILHFNLSHADDVGLLAATYGSAVGVDVERVRSLPHSEDIADANFTDGERDALRELRPDEWEEGFFRCWTRKEAVVKALGDGLGQPLQTFDVRITADAGDLFVRVEGRSAGWWLRNLPAPAGFAAAGAVTARAGEEPPEWHRSSVPGFS